MIRRVGGVLVCSVALLLFESAAPVRPVPAGSSLAALGDGWAMASPACAAEPLGAPPAEPAPPASPAPAASPAPLSAQRALDSGVLIVVSLPTQTMFVFNRGVPWGSSRVSTGRRGHGTPAGLFPILQKAVHHRSTIYSGAPMPYMQRLTWGGVALHAGYVPAYRASHGCIRVPRAFARRLYALTDPDSTAVLVTRQSLASADGVRMLVGGRVPAPGTRQTAAIELTAAAARAPAAPARTAPAPPGLPAGKAGQTIQLVAAQSPQNAAAYWQQLVGRQPQLASLQHQIVPAVVNSRQFYRLRASGPGAAAICSGLASAGVACMKVSA
jgi:lipoprotein-anchoring transpeptidase ErfK/SrfK